MAVGFVAVDDLDTEVTPMEPVYVVCIKDHECPIFGAVPKGSRWHSDDPVVADAPANFKKERT